MVEQVSWLPYPTVLVLAVEDWLPRDHLRRWCGRCCSFNISDALWELKFSWHWIIQCFQVLVPIIELRVIGGLCSFGYCHRYWFPTCSNSIVVNVVYRWRLFFRGHWIIYIPFTFKGLHVNKNVIVLLIEFISLRGKKLPMWPKEHNLVTYDKS